MVLSHRFWKSRGGQTLFIDAIRMAHMLNTYYWLHIMHNDWRVIICLICSFLEEERQTLTESWKKAESARKFLQSEVAALKGQREKLKEELQGVTDKMVYLRDKPVTPPDRLANY